MNKKITMLLTSFLLLFFVLSCSRSEPKITFGFIELVYYQEKDRPQERFSFFIIPEDEDGIENLADLYLYHDREQLRWHIANGDWITYEHEGKTWIGTRGIAIHEGETLPRGQFRAVLVNKGGEKSERNFSFDAPEDPRFPFPSLVIDDGRYTIKSSYAVSRLVCYNDGGGYIYTANVTSLSGAVEELGLSLQTRSVALWAEDAQYFTSAFTDVVPVRR
jgi:hypothetical protein